MTHYRKPFHQTLTHRNRLVVLGIGALLVALLPVVPRPEPAFGDHIGIADKCEDDKTRIKGAERYTNAGNTVRGV